MRWMTSGGRWPPRVTGPAIRTCGAPAARAARGRVVGARLPLLTRGALARAARGRVGARRLVFVARLALALGLGREVLADRVHLIGARIGPLVVDEARDATGEERE